MAEKTIVYSVATKLVTPFEPGAESKLHAMKKLKGFIAVSPVAEKGMMLWHFDTKKHAEDAVLECITLKLDPDKAVHRFLWNGSDTIDYKPENPAGRQQA